jgi:hypothetical protein
MQGLIEDLAANNITDESETGSLNHLISAMQTVANDHVGLAAATLRDLAMVSKQAPTASAPDPAKAAQAVDSAARELSLLVLHLGFREATEVVARELHVVAQTQAVLRLRTMMSEGTPATVTLATSTLADAQRNLAQWLSRLFAGVPRDKETTIKDALVAFNLSRLIKQLRGAGVGAKMLESVALIREGKPGGATGLQAEVIRALLRAEFRLRVGSEHEALVKASDLFTSQASEQKALRVESASLTPDQFRRRRIEMGQAQVALQRKLQLLLMPTVPAPRPRLFDIDLPTRPPVDELLVTAEGSMEKAEALIIAGDRAAATTQQRQVETSFLALAEIVRGRIAALTERERVASRVSITQKRAMDIVEFEERQLDLLEKIEDAAADRKGSASLARLQHKLIEGVEKYRAGIVEWNEGLATPNQDVLPLLNCLEKMARAMTNAVPSLEGNQPAKATDHLEKALEALADASSLLERQAAEAVALSTILEDTWIALAPAPYVADIQAEQRDLLVAAKKARPADLPGLAIVQKNLVHAVNAVLNSLEVLAHQIESGTVMLFAKDDMDAAAVALATKDLAEAEDAGSFVAESLQGLLVELQTVGPRYSYVLEVTECFHEIVSEGVLIHAAQRQLREKAMAAPDDTALAGLIDEQRALEARAKTLGSLNHKTTGLRRARGTAGIMTEKAGDRAAFAQQMKLAEDAISADTARLLELMTHFAILLKPPAAPEVAPEFQLTLDALAVASLQKDLYRKTQRAKPKQAVGLAAKQRELAKRCAALIPRARSHPNLVLAKRRMLEAAARLDAGSVTEAITSQLAAGEVLRYFIIEYVQKYVIPAPPGPPEDAAPSDPVESLGDDMSMFMPGAISGGKPKGGRQEWEVLGRRDRAALNENFARELPLEYRAILKAYYETLAR